MTVGEVASEYTGRGELPDRLAFVPPTHTELYIALEAAGTATATTLCEEVDKSDQTVYRHLNDLEELGLVERQPTIDFSVHAPAKWAIVEDQEEVSVHA